MAKQLSDRQKMYNPPKLGLFQMNFNLNSRVTYFDNDLA